MNKLLALLTLFLVTACQPDTAELQDSCTQAVKDGLATCTQDAWERCDQSYQMVMDDIQRENEELKEQIIKLRNMYEDGCSTFVNGALQNYLEGVACVYNSVNPHQWDCHDSVICQPFDPSHP